MNVLFVGATGNLGRLILEDLLTCTKYNFRILVHRTQPVIPKGFESRLEIFHGDLDRPETLEGLSDNIDVVIMMAGVLFVPFPKKRLWQGNFEWSKRLIDLALKAQVKRFILTSYPQVAGNTFPDSMAGHDLRTNTNLDHSLSRLEAEKYLLESTQEKATSENKMEAVIIRSGMVYGPNTRLLGIVKTLMKKNLLCVWNQKTWMHLISQQDFLDTYEIAVRKPGLSGIYNACDDTPIFIQDLWDLLSDFWKLPKAKRAPQWAFRLVALICEIIAFIPGVPCFVNRELVNMGMLSAFADTSRFRREIKPQLKFASIKEGLFTLKNEKRELFW
jgi:nucleoside-diphosphate-sugar epimerase